MEGDRGIRPGQSSAHPVSDAEEKSRTIADFGAQWTQFTKNPGYYGTVEMLRDIVEPLFPIDGLRGAMAAEIGSGTGRIVNMMLDAGAANIIAVEPSDAYDVLLRNTAERKGRITYVHAPGGSLPVDRPLDVVLSIGVLHHVEDPRPIVSRVLQALKPGGHFVVWLYAREGNELYLRLVLPLRALTKRIPDLALRALSHVLTWILALYIKLCRWVPLPMRDYMTNVLGKYGYYALRLTVFDQLNPSYAKYYTEPQARSLLSDAGFADVRTFHRHGYSWTVVGTK